jgi:hypothetical protein
VSKKKLTIKEKPVKLDMTFQKAMSKALSNPLPIKKDKKIKG